MHQVQRLFFAHDKSIQILQNFLKVLVIGCIYKTNRFRMPLLVIVEATSLHQTFHVGFAFLKMKIVDDYEKTLQQMRAIYQDYTVIHPKVIITDRDLELLVAI